MALVNSSVMTALSNNMTNISANVANIIFNDTSEKYAEVSENGQPSLSSTSRSTNCTSTTVDPFNEFGPPEGVEYIFVPLSVMIFVIILSAMVLVISRKRRLERLRHRLMPLYNFDPSEEGEDDWETELLDENFVGCQKRGYQSMGSEENAELFGRH